MNGAARLVATGAIVFVALVASRAQAGLREGLEAVKAHQYEQGFAQVQHAAEMGSALAQRYMGHYYSLSWGRAKDWSKAEAWYSRGAAGNDAGAQARLALYYFNGKLGAARDCEKARQFALQSARQKVLRAYQLLANSYESDICGPPDYKESTRWLLNAANEGDPGAAQVLGVHYWQGSGVEQNFEEAHKWFLKAANQGDAVAMYQLALMYLGDGRKLDLVQAMTWIELAQKAGIKDEYTTQRLKLMRQKWSAQLKPEQRQEVDQRVAQFQPQPLLPQSIEREWQKDLENASNWDSQHQR